MLRPLRLPEHPDLLTTLADDAAVFRLSTDQVMVQTVDFFTPIVDDPWTYGAIAAANSMSDVYAMGGDVLLALNVAAFPDTLPPEVLSAVFEGGASKVAEAGAVIAGGHTVVDDEPKYGLSVTGTIHPERILTKAGAQPNDHIFLTKPLGTGVITTALKRGKAEASHVDAAVEAMLTLNRAASLAAREVGGVHACTDITGFGLLGHLFKLARASGVTAVVDAAAVPYVEGARESLAAGFVPGGSRRNLDWVRPHLQTGVEEEELLLLADAQTSGGLLVAGELPGHPVIGELVAGGGSALVVR